MSATPERDLAEVAVGLPPRELFHYEVPPALRASVARGSVVAVPFGKQTVPGFVIALGGEPPAGITRLRPIRAVLEAGAALSGELLDFARATADYYGCGLGELLRAAVPVARLRRKGKTADAEAVHGAGELLDRRLRPAGGAAERAAAARRSPLAARLFELLERSEAGVLYSAARAAAGTTPELVRRLVGKCLIEAVDEPVARDLRAAPAPTWRSLALEPTAGQREAIEAVRAALGERRFAPFLLHGVTGSGKTLVYLALVAEALRLGRGSILLVPEIALTPVLARELRGRFGDELAVLHSGLPAGERHDAWRRVRQGRARVVFGARSALFAPVVDLGLLVVDEEHDPSYKQDERPHYNARDAALLRGKGSGAAVVLGSATPSLESFHNALEGRYRLLELPGRSQGQELPAVEIVDLREDYLRRGSNLILSARLTEALEECLARGEQAIVLLNRRGYASFLLCRECGQRAECPRCSVCLVFHRARAELSCHHCEHAEAITKQCGKCGGTFLHLVGQGTEKVEQAVSEALPRARVGRLDRDAVRRKGELGARLEAFARREIDILVGTQMVAKGHDFPDVTLVGVISVDAMLALPDFRTTERAFALLTQVAGRAGRGDRPGRVVLQTFHPDNEAVQLACAQDYRGFFEREMRLRRALGYPPAGHLALLLLHGKDRARALEQGRELGGALRELGERGLGVRGPALAPIERLKGEYRVQLLLKAASRPPLRRALERIAPRIRPLLERGVLDLDVDPYDLM